MNHFTDAVNMVGDWRKATPQEAAQGFVAMFPMTYFCQVDNRILTIDFEGKCKETGLRYKQKATWIGYTEAMLEKRAKRGDDVPSFWKPQEEMERAA